MPSSRFYLMRGETKCFGFVVESREYKYLMHMRPSPETVEREFSYLMPRFATCVLLAPTIFSRIPWKICGVKLSSVASIKLYHFQACVMSNYFMWCLSNIVFPPKKNFFFILNQINKQKYRKSEMKCLPFRFENRLYLKHICKTVPKLNPVYIYLSAYITRTDASSVLSILKSTSKWTSSSKT